MNASIKNRILMLLENDFFPQDTRVYLEATALIAAGYRVSVICPAKSDQVWHEELDGVSVYRYPAPSSANSFLGYVWEYGYSMAASFAISLLVLCREGFDVIHAHNPPDTFVFIAALYKLLGKRFVYDHHDLSPEMYNARFADGGNRLVYRVLALFEKLSCQLADQVIATNESYKTVQMQRDQVPEDRITIVRNGPDLQRFQQVAPDSELREKGSTIIGYVGIMGFQDGIDYLLRALQHLIHDLGRKDFFCVIIGTGAAQESLKMLATELDLDQHVWFTGYVSEDDLIRYLSTADICVDPDPSNPFNDRSTMIKMMEYMAMGKPIVAFDLPEHRFTAQDAAAYARPNDELDFALQVAMLMDDPDRCKTMGQAGQQRIQMELSWPHQSKHLLQVYQKLGTCQRIGLSSTANTVCEDLRTTAEA